MVSVLFSSDSRYNINKSRVESAVMNVLRRNNINNEVEIEVLIVGDRKMHELNKKYRQVDETTDVLSFSLTEGGKVGFVTFPDKILRLGSVVISFPEALKNAAQGGLALEEEINFLVEHGTNHLLGIHHD